MDPTNEIKSLLSLYVDEKIRFDEFHSIFVDFLRASRQFEGDAQQLIWSIELAIASVGLGRWTREEFRKECSRLAYVQYNVRCGIASHSLNHPEVLPKLVLEGASVDIGHALEPAL